MAYVPNRPTQSYSTADQSGYVGVSGNNQANEYLRYKDELDRQKREREEAQRKAKAGWWKRGLVNAGTGALTGFLAGGPVGAGIGAAGGFGLSALGDATGMNGMSYGGGAGQIAGMAGGAAYNRYLASKPSSGMGGYGGGPASGPQTPSLGDYQLSRPSYDPSSSFNFDTNIDYRKYYSGF